MLDDLGIVKKGFEGKYSAVTQAAKGGRAGTHGVPRRKHQVANGLARGLTLDTIIYNRFRHRIRKQAERLGLNKYVDIDQAFFRLGRRTPDEYFREQFGYSFTELQLHLAKQFREGMCWYTFASGEIHIDHKTPLIAFDITDAMQLRNAFALCNLQLLWGWENSAKGAVCDLTGKNLRIASMMLIQK